MSRKRRNVIALALTPAGPAATAVLASPAHAAGAIVTVGSFGNMSVVGTTGNDSSQLRGVVEVTWPHGSRPGQGAGHAGPRGRCRHPPPGPGHAGPAPSHDPGHAGPAP